MQATTIITTKPARKRTICCLAQGSKWPPATEYSIAKPMLAITVINSTKPQLISSSLSRSRAVRRWTA